MSHASIALFTAIITTAELLQVFGASIGVSFEQQAKQSNASEHTALRLDSGHLQQRRGNPTRDPGGFKSSTNEGSSLLILLPLSPLLQRLSSMPSIQSFTLAMEERPLITRLSHAKPSLGSFPCGHPPGCSYRLRSLVRSRNRLGCR